MGRRTASLSVRGAASMLVFFATPTVARAEIAIGESVEWLTAKAARVLVGRVVSVGPPDTRATGKSADLQLLAVQVTETLKGAPRQRVCVAVRQGGLQSADAFCRQATELIFFLAETQQATSFDGLVCNLWPLRGGDALPAIVHLDAPGKRLLSAAGFRVLRARAEAVQAVRDAVRQLAGVKGSTPTAVPTSVPTGDRGEHFLEVPYGSEVYSALYSGSSCYLIVPVAIFPSARPRLGQ